MKSFYLFLTTFVLSTVTFSQTKILFDASKGQMAGNADWIIDADVFDIRFTGGPASLGGSESNPQRFPTPSQSSITATTPEDFWTGAASSWAVDCAKLGYSVESLPYNGLVTFGNANNPQDLSNYKIFVTIEPNILYSQSEKIALLSFVQNGGGLFMVSGHDGADRNNDGFDAIAVLNDFINNNGVVINPFGINFDISNTGNITSTNFANNTNNAILNGSFGAVTLLKYFQGATININPTINSTATGLIYKTGFRTSGTSDILFASAIYGTGKVVAIGDSSPIDDGTGDPIDNLFFGYTDANGSHRNLIMNATKWLANQNLDTYNSITSNISFTIAPNPVENKLLNLNYFAISAKNLFVEIFDLTGRLVHSQEVSNSEIGFQNKLIDLKEYNSGIYICKINDQKNSAILKFSLE